VPTHYVHDTVYTVQYLREKDREERKREREP